MKTGNELPDVTGVPLGAALARKVAGGFAEQAPFRQFLDICRTPLPSRSAGGMAPRAEGTARTESLDCHELGSLEERKKQQHGLGIESSRRGENAMRLQSPKAGGLHSVSVVVRSQLRLLSSRVT